MNIVIGQNAQINGTLDVSSKQEVITVTGEAPLIDMRSNARTNNFNQHALQNIPSARDPWVILQQSAGIVMDRENIGGNMSGQQSNFIARGAATTQQKWNLDGIDITDMSATGALPVYYDFDAFDEMQISTGCADVTMQIAGVGPACAAASRLHARLVRMNRTNRKRARSSSGLCRRLAGLPGPWQARSRDVQIALINRAICIWGSPSFGRPRRHPGRRRARSASGGRPIPRPSSVS